MKKKLPFILLISIILLAAFLRLYRIADYMTFLGDEGRDVIVAKNILEGHFTLLGPRSSAGDFFMGPVYYYMITPFLWLFRMDPVGPAVMVGLLGVVTVWLTYFVGKKWFGEKTGLFAAALYAVSPIVITYSHSSWNPDVLPFFALLLMYTLYDSVVNKRAWKHFLFIGFLLGISLQLHYLSLFLCVIVAVYVLVGTKLATKKLQILPITKKYLQIFAGFLIGLSPFLAFEFRHGFPNIKTIFTFIFGGTTQDVAGPVPSFFSIVPDVFFRIFAKLVFFYPTPDHYSLYPSFFLQLLAVGAVVLAVLGTGSLWFVKNRQAALIAGLWIILGVLLFGLYKKAIYEYHFTFLFPLPFLLIGLFFAKLSEWGKNSLQKIAAICLCVILFVSIFAFNLSGMPFRYEPNRQKNQAKVISESVIEHAKGKPYNFALISGGNSDHAYRYFLDYLGHPPVVLDNLPNDPERKTVTGQLIVVCEDTACKPLGNSLFDVANFGRGDIAEEWTSSVVKVYRLVPYVEKQ